MNTLDTGVGTLNDEPQNTSLDQSRSEAPRPSVLPWAPAVFPVGSSGNKSESASPRSTATTVHARTSTTSVDLEEVHQSSEDSALGPQDQTSLASLLLSAHDFRGIGLLPFDEGDIAPLILCDVTEALAKTRDTAGRDHKGRACIGDDDISAITSSSARSGDGRVFEIVRALIKGKGGEQQCLFMLPDSGSSTCILPLQTLHDLDYTIEDLDAHELDEPLYGLSNKPCWPLGKIMIKFRTPWEHVIPHKASFYVLSNEDFDAKDGILSAQFCKKEGILIRRKPEAVSKPVMD